LVEEATIGVERGEQVSAMQIELSEDEHRLLAELLDQDFRDLKEEINKTEAFDYKRALKVREQTLVGLMEKVGRRIAT